MDLSKVTFPTFVLEPRSMLERITDFMAHPDLIFGWVLVPSCILLLLRVGCSAAPACTTNPIRAARFCSSERTCCVDHVPSPCLITLPEKTAYIISRSVRFAAQNCVKNLKNASYACSSITSQAGTSSPRASRSREYPSPFSDSFLCIRFALQI